MTSRVEVQALIETLFPDNLSREISPADLRQVTHDMISIVDEEVLVAESFAIQEPAGLDTPLQIEFGPENLTNPNVTIDAAGEITFLTSGSYLAFLAFYFNRTTSAGEAQFMIRSLVGGVQNGNPVGIIAADDDMTIPIRLSTYVVIPEGAEGLTYTIEMQRDSAGIDNGQLQGLTSSTDWGNAPSSRIRIIKTS